MRHEGSDTRGAYHSSMSSMSLDFDILDDAPTPLAVCNSVTVPSRTDPSTSYSVTRQPDGILHCQCRGSIYNKGCDHQRAASEKLASIEAGGILAKDASGFLRQQSERLERLADALSSKGTVEQDQGAAIWDSVDALFSQINSLAAKIHRL